ncbi:MAG TPA: amino acid ABC transporter permease, partial [Burkholderiaceae bacterium]|nr:amino acid ABC transporter permease [Burkholderiaceae bacterium]
PELTQYALQVGEETARPIEVYLAVTVLYAISALAVNRVFAWIEKRARVPGFVASGTGAGGH